MAKQRERYMTVLGGYTLDMHDNGKLIKPEPIDMLRDGDYGSDPLGDGKFRMVPSGDVVDATERDKRLGR